MKKIFMIFIMMFFIILLTGCEKISYKELFINNEIVIKETIEQEKLNNIITTSNTNLKSTKLLQVNMYFYNDYTELTAVLKYDKEKGILIYEYNQKYYEDSRYYEGSIYIIDGISYNYKRVNLNEVKYKEEQDIQFIIDDKIPGYSVDYLTSEYILEYGQYSCGKDKYNNLAILFNVKKEYPRMFQCCHALVIDEDRPIFFADYFYGIMETYEFTYDNIEFEFPDLTGYEFKESE